MSDCIYVCSVRFCVACLVHLHLLTLCRAYLVHIGKYSIGDLFAVKVPGGSILDLTLSLITRFPVNQQDGEVCDIKVWQEM